MSKSKQQTDLFVHSEDVLREKIVGVLWGMAVGDALGLPYEGLTPQRQDVLLRGRERLEYRLFGSWGMCSDDTEHACMVGQALLRSGGEPELFQRSLAWRFRWWLLGFPAGLGSATLRSIGKLWLGWSPERSGVFSAGNGPAMRAPLLGVCLAHDAELLMALVQKSTEMTHTDPKACEGALAIARATQYATLSTLDSFSVLGCLGHVLETCGCEELRGLLVRVKHALLEGVDPDVFVEQMGWGRGVSGYVYDTVPASLFVWLRTHDDLEASLRACIAMGGDTDTTGAIVGGMAGALCGASSIVEGLRKGIKEWPRSMDWIEQLGERLAVSFGGRGKAIPRQAVPLSWWGIPFRNAFFFGVVLAHGVRRLLPPYENN